MTILSTIFQQLQIFLPDAIQAFKTNRWFQLFFTFTLIYYTRRFKVFQNLSFLNNSFHTVNLPPSPKGKWPILGHLPLLASTTETDTLLDQLANELGPIYSLKLGKINTIVISNEELARESLIKKGKKYAGRWAGRVLMMSTDEGQDIAMAPYGERWRHLRRVVHKVLTPLALSSMDTSLEREALRIVKKLNSVQFKLNSPDLAPFENTLDVQQLFMHFTCNIVVTKSLGITFDDERDAEFQMICDSILEVFQLAGVGGVEDYFPDSYIEGFIVRQKRKAMDLIKEKFHNGFILDHIKRLQKNLKEEDEKNSGIPIDRELCYAEELLLKMGEENLSINDIKLFIMDFLSAGIDTTAATLYWVCLYLINHPEVQEKAQEEIDRVLDGQRLPNLSDIESMPYIRAILKETLRIAPVGPLGLPRMSIEEDNLAGYTIPSGCQVIYNIVGIHRSMYDRPCTFDPSRWMKFNDPRNGKRSKAADIKSNDEVQNTLHDSGIGSPLSPESETQLSKLDFLDGIFTFGQGRRLCPGAHLAFRELFLVTSNILACFKLYSHDKKPIPIVRKFGLTVLPNPKVSMVVVPRDPVLLQNWILDKSKQV